MSKASDTGYTIAGIMLGIVLPIIGLLLHLFFCYLAYQVGSFWAVVATFCLPVISEIYWLIVLYNGNGFLVIHIIFIVYVIAWILLLFLPGIIDSRSEARSRRKKQKEEQALTATEQYNADNLSAEAIIANRRAMEREVVARAKQTATTTPAQTPVIVPQQPVSQEEQLRRRAELAERRCQELADELRQQKETNEKDILSAQIEELERTLNINRPSLPADGIADLERELMEKKARYFDLPKKN